MRTIPRSWGTVRAINAFTLVEMLVVIAIIGILVALLLPVISKAKQKSQGVYCLNNGHQMMTTLMLYSGDSNDYFPPNPDDGNTIPGYNWCSGRAGVGGPAEFNPDILLDSTRCLVAPYLKGNVTVFHCPGDKRMGKYQGADPNMMGRIIPAARTFSMSQAVGTIDPGYDANQTANSGQGVPHSGAPTLSVNGPWLNNQRTHRRDSPWRTYGKFSAINDPGPSKLWVLVDEDIENLNDAAFAFGMEDPQWFDEPGVYHNGGCGFAFADGHSESHHWMSTARKKGHRAHTVSAEDRADWTWMRERTSSNVNGPMPPPGP